MPLTPRSIPNHLDAQFTSLLTVQPSCQVFHGMYSCAAVAFEAFSIPQSSSYFRSQWLIHLFIPRRDFDRQTRNFQYSSWRSAGSFGDALVLMALNGEKNLFQEIKDLTLDISHLSLSPHSQSSTCNEGTYYLVRHSELYSWLPPTR